ncbi:unnamed protein product, partial [Tenebrio molitor]
EKLRPTLVCEYEARIEKEGIAIKHAKPVGWDGTSVVAKMFLKVN